MALSYASGIACSPEGWIVGEWRWYPDNRGAGIWFPDDEWMMFSANKTSGEFVIIEGQTNKTARSILAQALEPVDDLWNMLS